MNKKYMDFVPVKKVGSGAGNVSMAGGTGGIRASSGVGDVHDDFTGKHRAKEGDFVVSEIFEEKLSGANDDFERSTVEFGVIEDLQPRFVKTEVPKRALGGNIRGDVKGGKLRGGGVKSGDLGVDSVGRSAVRPVIAHKVGRNTKVDDVAGLDKQAYKVPKFVNTERINKRPLSKNVYSKKVIPSTVDLERENKGPVTIIARPEKDSRIGMVVAVVITVILGAAAGIVAFLLLPK